MTELDGRVAFVTGGGSGLGEALAVGLAGAGCRVVVTDLWPERATAVAAALAESGATALGLACDVSDRSSVARARAEAERAFGPVSLLFANAGVTALQSLADMSPADVDWIMAVDLLGPLHCLQAFLPAMVAARDGHVVTTASLAGLVPEALSDHAPYAGAKAGLIGLMLNLRQELSRSDVGCTVVCPGGIESRIGESPANRPQRFGGPSSGGIAPPAGFTMQRSSAVLPAAEVARLVLEGVRGDRPMVVTDPTWRDFFLESYVRVVLDAFDEAATMLGEP